MIRRSPIYLDWLKVWQVSTPPWSAIDRSGALKNLGVPSKSNPLEGMAMRNHATQMYTSYFAYDDDQVSDGVRTRSVIEMFNVLLTHIALTVIVECANVFVEVEGLLPPPQHLFLHPCHKQSS